MFTIIFSGPHSKTVAGTWAKCRSAEPMESSVLTTDFCLIFNRYFYDCLCYCATSLFICLFISDYLALAGALREEEIPWVLK